MRTDRKPAMTKRTRPRRVKLALWIWAVATVDYGPGYWDEKEGVYRIPSTPVWFIPRTAAAYDAMVEQMALGICRDAGLAGLTRKYAIDALSAIGITRPRDTSAQLRRKRNTTNSQETLDNAMADWVSSYPRD